MPVSRFLGEMVPIRLVSACPDHDVDARAATEPFAHIQGQAASIQMGAGLALKGPITLRTEIQRPQGGLNEGWGQAAVPCLQQQHASIVPLGKTRRDHATRRAGTTNDEIESIRQGAAKA